MRLTEALEVRSKAKGVKRSPASRTHFTTKSEAKKLARRALALGQVAPFADRLLAAGG